MSATARPPKDPVPAPAGEMPTAAGRPSTADWLERAATWRFASLLFQLPSVETVAELRAVARDVRPEWRDEAEQLASFPLDGWQTEYHRVLGPGGCPASESSYDDNALAGRGPLLARVAGFYEAFAFRPHENSREVPDHISHELGFLGYMALKCAFAAYAGEQGPLEVAREAYARFLSEHLESWIDRFDERIAGVESALFTGATCWTQRLSKTPRSD